MRRTTRVAAVLAVALLAGATAAFAAKIKAPTEYELQAAVPVGTDSAQREWFLGGFSGLSPIGSSGTEYWTLTDRGPNDDANLPESSDPALYCTAKPTGKVIFLPGFNPQLIKIGLSQDRIKIQERILLHDGANPASGLPNLVPFDEPAFEQTDASAKTCAQLSGNPLGVDTEGVVVDPRDGSFWLADEYRPSIIHVAPDGQILSRLVPKDLPAETPVDVDATPTLLTASTYAAAVSAAGGSFAVQRVFPAIVNGFRKNRGFEGVAVSPDGRWLYTLLQSPMDYITAWNTPATPPWIKPAVPALTNGSHRNPARRSPYIRVFKIDIADPAAPVVAAEWIYLLNHGFVGSNPDGIGEADRISEMVWLGTDKLLIQERDDARPTQITDLHTADFTGATNLLDPANAAAFALGAKAAVPTLEMTSPVPAFITPAAKSPAPTNVAALLSGEGFLNSKIEGVALLPAKGANTALLAVANDNDFDLAHTVTPSIPSIPERVELFPRP